MYHTHCGRELEVVGSSARTDTYPACRLEFLSIGSRDCQVTVKEEAKGTVSPVPF